MKPLMVAALFMCLFASDGAAQGDLEFDPQPIPFDQLQPFQPEELSPNITVPRDQVTVGPPQTFTCPQAAAQLQYLVGQPDSVAYQVTFTPLQNLATRRSVYLHVCPLAVEHSDFGTAGHHTDLVRLIMSG